MLEPGFKSGLGLWSPVGQSILSASKCWAFPSLLCGPCVYDLHLGRRQLPPTMLHVFSTSLLQYLTLHPKTLLWKFNMSVYSPFIHYLKDYGGPMLFRKYDLAHSSVWCPALACRCQLDYVPLKIHMLKFYLPVPWLCSYLEIVFTEAATD